MTDIGPRLRALIIHARKDPGQWGKSKGLSQAELAAKAGTSQVWLRQIETGTQKPLKRTHSVISAGCLVLTLTFSEG
jgi:transcriptional regulator with XRE-family HTH domain